MSISIRSRTARCLGAAIGALALAAALPATASADRDGRGWRQDRHDDHGRRHEWGGRDHGRGYRHFYRRVPVHRHGPSCGPAYGYGYRPYHPHVVFYRGGWFFGR